MMRTLPELLNSWLPPADRPSILVVAEETAGFLAALERLEHGERPFEFVRVDSAADAQRLIRRGALAILLVDAGTCRAGALELLLDAVSKDRPPQVLVASRSVNERSATRCVQRVDERMDAASWMALVQECAKRFQSGKLPGLRAGELLEALADLPGEGWLRVSSGEDFGDICISNGKAVYCEVGRLAGDEAAQKLCEWRNCQFEFRALPEFLRQNMNCPLGNLHGTRKAPAVEPSGAIPMPPAEIKEVEFEEPEEFPALAEMVESTSTAKAGPVDYGLEEPDELPAFDAVSAEPDIFVEEPSVLEFAEPSEAEPAFHSFAILCMNRMLHCEPAVEARYYDPEALSVFYERSKAYVMRHQLGEVPLLQLSGGDSTIHVVSGGDCLVAARTTRRNLTEQQAEELRRKAQAYSSTSPAFSL